MPFGFYLILLITKKPINVFFVSIIIGGSIEFFSSLMQEKIFGTISWNYSNTFLNIGGRTNLQYGICWGFIGLLFLYLLPYFDKIDLLINKYQFRIIIYILMFTLLFDISISIIASSRQSNRRLGIEPKNKFEIFLDKHYSDNFLDRVYNNKTWVKYQ